MAPNLKIGIENMAMIKTTAPTRMTTIKTTFFSTLFVIGIGWVLILPHPIASGVQLPDGTVAFTQPPLLVGAKTPYPDTDVPDTIYYFTLELSPNAGAPLQRVAFSQTEGSQLIRFDLKNSYAFEGTQGHQGPKLPLQPPVKGDSRTRNITVTFDPPVPPGKTVTIALRTVRNPLYDGTYLFGVTAFPAGEQTTGQFIGYGRLQFYTDVP